eukprot:6188-Heterococcus_DN1.PRE.1
MESDILLLRAFSASGLSAVEFVHLLKLAERRTITKGNTLAHLGKKQDHVYLMIDGTAEVVSGDGDTLDSYLYSTHSLFTPQHAHITTVTQQDHEGDTAAEDDNDYSEDEITLHEQSIEELIEGDNSSSHARGLVFDDVSGTDRSTTANNNNTTATVVTVNEGVVSDELRHSSTTVRAVTDCQVYAWDFHLLRAYLKRHPLEGNAMQVSISADLTRKLDQSRDASH